MHSVKKNSGHMPEFDLIELALNGKQKGLEKVISMIDTVLRKLMKEQTDDNKKAYCEKADGGDCSP